MKNQENMKNQGRKPQMSIAKAMPKDGPTNKEMPELDLSAKYWDKNGSVKVEIHNCLEMEQEFQTLKDGGSLKIKASEDQLPDIVRLWNLQLILRDEPWQVEAVPGQNAIRRKQCDNKKMPNENVNVGFKRMENKNGQEEFVIFLDHFDVNAGELILPVKTVEDIESILLNYRRNPDLGKG